MKSIRLLGGLLVGLATVAATGIAVPAQAGNNNRALNEMAVQMYMQNMAAQQQAQAQQSAFDREAAAYKERLRIQNEYGFALLGQQNVWKERCGNPYFNGQVNPYVNGQFDQRDWERWQWRHRHYHH